MSPHNTALAAHATAIRALGKQTVENVIEIGRRLTECKRICGYGNWLPWLEREFGWSEDTAENFIQVSKLSHQIPKLSEFNIPVSAIYLLAKPKTPETVRTEIIERAQAGEPIPVAEVKRTIQRAKGRKKPVRKTSPPTPAKPAPTPAVVAAEAVHGDSHSPLDVIGNMEEIDPEHGRAKALAILARVPYREAIEATRDTAARLIDKALNPDRPPSRDDTGPASNGEIARKDARIEEPQADKRRLEIENVGLRSEVEEAKAAHKPEGKGEDSELGNLLRAWDRASQGAREKFKARVGLVAVQLPAKAMDNGLDIPECLRRAAP